MCWNVPTSHHVVSVFQASFFPFCFCFFPLTVKPVCFSEQAETLFWGGYEIRHQEAGAPHVPLHTPGKLGSGWSVPYAVCCLLGDVSQTINVNINAYTCAFCPYPAYAWHVLNHKHRLVSTPIKQYVLYVAFNHKCTRLFKTQLRLAFSSGVLHLCRREGAMQSSSAGRRGLH